MALNQFPNTPTLGWSVIKAPNWATRLQRSVSGRELRVSDYVLPVYTFTLLYEVLRDKWDTRGGPGAGYAITPDVHDDLRQIWNFFNQQRGSAIPFMFYDPTDNTTRSDPATAAVVQIGVGDGVTTNFQACSLLQAPVIPTVINTLTPSGASLDPNTGLIEYGTAPSAGTSITIDMQYNYKVRFTADALEAENFMYQLWTMKQLKLTSVLY